MVDFLKRSVENLEAPSCPDCSTQMMWYRSMRMSMKELTITHVFQCPDCNRLAEVKSTQKRAKNGTPRKAMLPHSAAA
jgi:ssDNA-binding Zn-finger/Zn-ribbon topoisomerase 1